MYRNSRGAALLQVLMLSALLAGLAVMVLRATLSRQVTARQTRHAIGVHQAVTACIAEINDMWALMTPEQYKTSLSTCTMPPFPSGGPACGESVVAGEWYCHVDPFADGSGVCVTARMHQKDPTKDLHIESPCQIDFVVNNGVDRL